MLTVTPAATKQIRVFSEGKEPAPVRVFIHSGGCGGPQLAMAFDEIKNGDEVIEIDGITFVVEKELIEAVKPISVTFQEEGGFAVESSLQLGGGGCSGCGSSSSCCSH